MPVPTMKVKLKDNGQEMIVNISDFNPYLMEELEPSKRGAPGEGNRGPTFEEFIEAGYKPEFYPPKGFDEIPSKGYVDYLKRRIKEMEPNKTDAGGTTTSTPGTGAGSPAPGTGAAPSAPASSPAPSPTPSAPAQTPAPGTTPSKQ